MTGAPPGRGPLVGRDEELAVLREALAESADGHGRFVLVSGEAGIGKSRLLEEVAATASATHVVLTGRAVEGGGAYRPVADALVGALRAGLDVTPASLGPYGPALARLLPDWSSVAGASSAEPGVDPGLVLGEAVARFLGVVGRGRPCLLLLEDLHWADADSWAVLAHVAVVVPSLPVVVVATMREDEPGTTPATALSRLPGVTTLRLARLSRADVHRLAVALGAARPRNVDDARRPRRRAAVPRRGAGGTARVRRRTPDPASAGGRPARPVDPRASPGARRCRGARARPRTGRCSTGSRASPSPTYSRPCAPQRSPGC